MSLFLFTASLPHLSLSSKVSSDGTSSCYFLLLGSVGFYIRARPVRILVRLGRRQQLATPLGGRNDITSSTNVTNLLTGMECKLWSTFGEFALPYPDEVKGLFKEAFRVAITLPPLKKGHRVLFSIQKGFNMSVLAPDTGRSGPC